MEATLRDSCVYAKEQNIYVHIMRSTALEQHFPANTNTEQGTVLHGVNIRQGGLLSLLPITKIAFEIFLGTKWCGRDIVWRVLRQPFCGLIFFFFFGTPSLSKNSHCASVRHPLLPHVRRSELGRIVTDQKVVNYWKHLTQVAVNIGWLLAG